MRELIRGISVTAVTRAYGMFTGLVVLTITARWLGPQGRGEYAAAITWATATATLSGLSLGQVSVNRMVDREPGVFEKMMGSLLAIAGLLSLLGLTVVGILYVVEPDFFGQMSPSVLSVGLLAVPFLLIQQYHGYLAFAVEEDSLYNRSMATARSVAMLVIGSMVVAGWGVVPALVGYLVGEALFAGQLLRGLIRRAASRIQVNLEEIRSAVRAGLRLHLNTVGALLFTSIDVLMVNSFLGSAATGHYQLAVQLINAAVLIPLAAQMVLYGTVTRMGPDLAWAPHRKILGGTIAIVLVGGALGWLIADEVVVLIGGSGFEPAAPVLRWLLVGLLGMTFSIVMAPQWIGRGLFLQASLLTLLVGVGNVAGNLLLIPRFGILGAAYAFVGVYVLAVIGNGAMAAYCEIRWKRAVRSDDGSLDLDS